ncbi:MAG: hypothetical protein Hyperionvirus49_2 [Hyperionvirus sp.]|uniref:Uncharacterized protein n=1 Tax=Hyperionvirus sp. TaxID=2487770 RepID=A0A3G5ACC7_9VIRU|nr:MAG: hypothetical protein Hyperionvirus49_2 [Hyperionvirus sp.]
MSKKEQLEQLKNFYSQNDKKPANSRKKKSKVRVKTTTTTTIIEDRIPIRNYHDYKALPLPLPLQPKVEIFIPTYIQYCMYNVSTFRKGYCVACGKRVYIEQIMELTDGNQTIICCHCGVDALVADEYFVSVMDRVGIDDVVTLIDLWHEMGFGRR